MGSEPSQRALNKIEALWGEAKMLAWVQTINGGAVARSRQSLPNGVVAQSEMAGHAAPGSGIRRQTEPGASRNEGARSE
jgi:hypothetical protein